MTFSCALAVLAALCPPSTQSPAQAAPPANPAPAQTTPPAAHKPAAGKVIFSRSTDANGVTTTHAGPASAPQMASAPIATDSERQAVTFTAYSMDVHLRPEAHQIAVRAQLTARNGGKAPLAHIPLQLSSQLNWERIRLEGRDIPLQV